MIFVIEKGKTLRTDDILVEYTKVVGIKEGESYQEIADSITGDFEKEGFKVVDRYDKVSECGYYTLVITTPDEKVFGLHISAPLNLKFAVVKAVMKA